MARRRVAYIGLIRLHGGMGRTTWVGMPESRVPESRALVWMPVGMAWIWLPEGRAYAWMPEGRASVWMPESRACVWMPEGRAWNGVLLLRGMESLPLVHLST